jgi:hypothetical protein
MNAESCPALTSIYRAPAGKQIDHRSRARARGTYDGEGKQSGMEMDWLCALRTCPLLPAVVVDVAVAAGQVHLAAGVDVHGSAAAPRSPSGRTALTRPTRSISSSFSLSWSLSYLVCVSDSRLWFPLPPCGDRACSPPMVEEEEVVVVWSGEGIGEANGLPNI